MHFCQGIRVTFFRQLLIYCRCYERHFYKNVAPPPPKKGATLHPHCPIALQWAFFTVSKVVVAERFYCNSSWIYPVFTPSNIPVLMKNGQTTVVWTPVFFITPSSIIRDSSKPTAPKFRCTVITQTTHSKQASRWCYCHNMTMVVLSSMDGKKAFVVCY